MKIILELIWLWGWGCYSGWALRSLWISHRHVKRTLRLAEDALLEQDLERAGKMVDRAEILLSVL